MDLPCACCGEPWEVYFIDHEMPAWEADLFRKGAGCPSCEGSATPSVRRRSQDRHTKAVLLSGATDDPHAFTFAIANSMEVAGNVPAWERPNAVTLLQCNGCENHIKSDPDVRKPYVEKLSHEEWAVGVTWAGKPYLQLHFHGEEWDKSLVAFVGGKYELVLGEKQYCPGCVEPCSKCGAITAAEEMMLPDGSFGKDEALCPSCFEQIPTCIYCGSQLEEDDEVDLDGYGPCCEHMNEDDAIDPVEDDDDELFTGDDEGGSFAQEPT